MKSCLSAADIFLYLEGEVGPRERLAFEEHLERCPGCRAALEESRLLQEAFTSLTPFEVPPGFARAVMSRIPERAGSAWRRLAAAAAAGFGLGAGLLGIALFTGESLPGALIAASRSLEAGLSGLIPLLAKGLKSAVLALGLLIELASTLAGGLSALSSTVRPEIAGLALGLGLVLSLLMLFGAKRLLSLGEKP